MAEYLGAMSDNGRQAAKPVEEGLMEEREKLIKCIWEMLKNATEKEVRLAYISTAQIVSK